MKNILIIFGTRPEVIKLAPVILKLKKYPKNFLVTICNTEQQKELSNQALEFFNLTSDVNLDIMEPGQALPNLQSKIMVNLQKLLEKQQFDAVIIQGDTMSAFCGSLFGFLNKISVFHIEAGLRSHNLKEPYPEEALRQMISRITDLHFAPTKSAAAALKAEKIPTKNIITVGNTVIDALFCLPKIELTKSKKYFLKQNIKIDDKLVLITVHRRENHGSRLDEIIDAIKTLSGNYPDHNFILPVHPNPNVKNKIYQNLRAIDNIYLENPLPYPQLVLLMSEAKLILTDSGGIQEEAPSFGCPTLVLREKTERNEGVEAGYTKLVGTKKNKIIFEAKKILNLNKINTRLRKNKNPYGDGKAAEKIVLSIKNFYKKHD